MNFGLIKKEWKKIAAIVLGATALAAGATLLNQPKQLGGNDVSYVEVRDQKIEFPFTDDNTNENVIISTDKDTYSSLYGKSNLDVYVSVENKSGRDQVIDLEAYFPRTDITVNSISQLASNVPYTITVDDTTTTQVACSGTSTPPCYDTKVIGSHKEDRIGNDWEDIGTSNSKVNTADWLSRGSLQEKPKPNERFDKATQVTVIDGQVAYFKVNLNLNPYLGFKKQEFYLEAVGNQGAYGQIDPTLYQDCNSGFDDYDDTELAKYRAQTFTATTSYSITSVKLLLFTFTGKHPGTLTLGIFNTDLLGQPTSTALTSGQIDGSGLTNNTNGIWYEFTLTPYTLQASTLYAIVLKNPDTADEAYWNRIDAGPYGGGTAWYSLDSGTTWNKSFSGSNYFDKMFETYGNEPGGNQISAPIYLKQGTAIRQSVILK